MSLKISGYYYETYAMLSIDSETIKRLIDIGKKHYDGYVNSICVPGQGSFLYGWSVMCDASGKDVITVNATSRQIDTLCKLTEMEAWHTAEHPMHGAMHSLLREIHDEQKRINALTE